MELIRVGTINADSTEKKMHVLVPCELSHYDEEAGRVTVRVPPTWNGFTLSHYHDMYEQGIEVTYMRIHRVHDDLGKGKGNGSGLL